MKIDLHNHTNYSDGVYTPLQLIQRAKENHVDIFALTDHDSVLGDEETFNLAKDYQIFVIKGMELSTKYMGESIHLVCLFKENNVPEEMIKFSNDLQKKRDDRARKMIQNIQEIYGLKANAEELIATSNSITRANMLRHIMKYNNMSREEASFYTSRESKAYIPAEYLNTIEGIKFAKENNAIVIFAHPCLVKRKESVEEIIQMGVDGIEVRYPSEKNNEEYFTSLANKYHLLKSAGSDCHGDQSHGDIGQCTLNEAEFEGIKKALSL